MKKLKVYITGGSGLLSVNLATLLNKKFEIFLNLHKKNIKISNTKNVKIDLMNYSKIKYFFLKYKPDVIIHTAAISNIEYCEMYKKNVNQSILKRQKISQKYVNC